MLQKHPAFDRIIRRRRSLQIWAMCKDTKSMGEDIKILISIKDIHCYQQSMYMLKKENSTSSVKMRISHPGRSLTHWWPSGFHLGKLCGHSASHRGRTPPFTGFGKAEVPFFCTMLHHWQQVTTTLLSLSQAALPRECCGFDQWSSAVLPLCKEVAPIVNGRHSDSSSLHKNIQQTATHCPTSKGNYVYKHNFDCSILNYGTWCFSELLITLH